MSEIDLQERFPEMRPIQSPPSLFSVNGCGLTVVGSRDFDPETGTYVKTHSICVIFVPLIPIGAYRVADAVEGWYFLGKVPLSSFARTWNVLLLTFVLTFGGYTWWHKHTSSPDYIAGKKMAEADSLVQAAQPGQAAGLYLDVALGNTGHFTDARAKLQQLVDDTPNQSPAEAAAVLKSGAKLHKEKLGLIPNVFERGLETAQKHADTDPHGALAVVDAVASLAPDPKVLGPFRLKLLELEVSRNPANTDAASKLAVIYEEQGTLDRCEKLLAPHRDKLGSSEGARILGQILFNQDQFDQAYPLLQAYTDDRLKKLHAAEAKFQEAMKNAENVIFSDLEKGRASGFDYKRYEKAAKTDKEALIGEYVMQRLKGNKAIQEAQEQIAQEGKVVPVTLDLGIILLRRGQALRDAAARKAELERAEKTFLSVRGQAGRTDQFRAFLAQVYYWLGKQDEGKKLFDEMLQANQRKFETLLLVSRMLREVGATTEARALAEEAYKKETDAGKKHQAAGLRSVMSIDLEDKINWLGKANPADADIKATLAWSQGEKAFREGREQDAVKHYRDATDIYSRQPASVAIYNNSALVYKSMYQASGDPADLLKAGELLEKAFALDARDTIVLQNIVDTMLEAAARDLIGPAIDLKAVKTPANLGLLTFLYHDRAGRDQLLDRARKHAGLNKVISFNDRLLVLAPKYRGSYTSLAGIHEFNRNLEGLRGVWQRVQEAELDQSDYRSVSLDYYSGKDDAKHRKEMEAGIQRARATLQAVRQAGAKGVTLAVALQGLVGRLLRTDGLDLPVNADEIVKLSEEAHAAAPSRATEGSLNGALLFRADRTLAKQDAGYRAIVEKSRRSLDPSYRIALALEAPASSRALVLANPDFQRVVANLKESQAKYPDDPSQWTWAILRSAQPELAVQEAKSLEADEIGKLERAIDGRTQPLSAVTAYRDYWYQQMTGNPAKGLEALKSCASQGVPLWLPK